MDRRWRSEGSSRTERALAEWLGEGPSHAPDGMLEGFNVALDAAPPQRSTTMVPFAQGVALAGAAAVVLALAFALGAASQFLGDRHMPGTGLDACPRVTRAENFVLAPAADPDAETTEVLSEPYIATMGSRLTNGNQIADVALWLDRDWSDEPGTMRLSGPHTAEWATEAGDVGRELSVRLGAPGRYRLSFIGEQSGCRVDVDLRAQLDTTLRTYDAERGLTEPPPPDRP